MTNDKTMTPGTRKSFSLFGIRMDSWTMSETVQTILARVAARQFTQLSVVNVAKLVAAQKNTELREALKGCDVVNVDGMGVVWGARFLGHHVPERVAGVELFLNLLAACEDSNDSIFLLGARQPVLERAVEAIRKAHPRLNIAGYHHGYFWDDQQEVVNTIRESGATFLFVAISSPQKELFVSQWREALGVSFVMGIGGSLDVLAGLVRRSPLWMQHMGLEWLFRFAQEPGRMWHRYLVSNSVFAFMLLRKKLFNVE